MTNELIINDYIVDCLVNEWNDYPEQVLDVYNINYKEWDEERIEEESNKILDKYIVLDTIVNYTDLEKSYQDCAMYFKYNNEMFGINYYCGPYIGIEVHSNPYKVKQITVTTNDYIPV